MDILLDFIVTLSRWCDRHLDQISLALVAVLLVLFGLTLGKYIQRLIGTMNIVFRVIILAIVYMLVFGLIINFVPALIKQLLSYLNYYSLFPILLLIMVFIGMIADKR
ncbi:DUF3392 family protein [Entomomonas asaccharolytica]|uniref:DUF3392 family protein n=1 Tax=Entomomonas asaccharolytica TaxID=2785331 RepID=A0A974NH94_9GAMM|nr:DUF3392 family protein [Entomomonas asaccharolytica]QQP86579.1 DUF3392 family protein [Entomomonas asaccharolytica]